MLPPAGDYLTGLNGPIIAAISIGGILTILSIGLFFGNLGQKLKSIPKDFKGKTIFLLAVYPVS